MENLAFFNISEFKIENNIDSNSIFSFDYVIVGNISYGGSSNFYLIDFLNNEKYELGDELSFFDNQGVLSKFLNNIDDSIIIYNLNNIIDSLPNYILNSKNITERYGCGGCRDNPIIYINTIKGSKKRYFYFDSVLNNLPIDKLDFITLFKRNTYFIG